MQGKCCSDKFLLHKELALLVRYVKNWQKGGVLLHLQREGGTGRAVDYQKHDYDSGTGVL
jgi:hypothetical protein